MGLIIFDFDGTIVDSFMVFIAVLNHLAQRFNYPEVPEQDIDYFRSLSSREVLQSLPFPRWQLPFYLHNFRQELKQHIDQLELFAGMAEVFTALKQDGHALGIVTSNSQTTVQKFLVQQQLDHLFDFVHSGQFLLGKDRVLRKLVRRYAVAPDHVICIGDETRDIEAARRVNLLTIAVSWGFNTRAVLADYHPDRVIDQPQQLLGAIQELLRCHPAEE